MIYKDTRFNLHLFKQPCITLFTTNIQLCKIFRHIFLEKKNTKIIHLISIGQASHFLKEERHMFRAEILN